MGNKKRLIDADALVLENSILMEDEYGLPFKAVYEQDIISAPTVNAIVVPCNVGDVLYTFCIKGIDDYFIRESVVSRIEISEDFGMKIIERRKDPSGAYFYFRVDIDEIGRSIFLTKEEALKKMNR